MNSTMTCSEEVSDALAEKRAVVALESTIITHGMPYPENLNTAMAVEQVVRDTGATPATIAALNGQLCVGLNTDQLNALAKTSDAMKLSRADLAFALSSKRTGSTTVAATMISAHLAGIKVFATGGIGGVHRGAEHSFDISADLHELARTPVTVVCAGAKAILDIPKTLEVLETLGVPVLTYQQDNLPAFWSQDSGIASPLRVNSVSEIADFAHQRHAIGIEQGMLIANPIPKDDEIDKATMDKHIHQALLDADEAGIKGKAVTPWLLGHIVKLTNAKSLASNQALIRNNASLAAKIALAY